MAKVTSVIVMVLSALLVILLLAGIAGVWWGQTQLRGIVTDVAVVADSGLERVQTAANQVNQVVTKSADRIDEVSTGISNAGAKIEETNLALVAAEKLLDQDLDPAVEQLTSRVSDVRGTIAIIDRMMSLLMLRPGASDSKLLTLADTIVQKIQGIGQAVADFRSTVKATKSQVTAEAVNALTTPLARVGGALDKASEDLTALGQRIDEEQAQLAVVRDRALTAITLAAIVLTLALLWMAFAQAGLFVHGYGVVRGRDPLARWHKGQGTDAASPSPQVSSGAV